MPISLRFVLHLRSSDILGMHDMCDAGFLVVVDVTLCRSTQVGHDVHDKATWPRVMRVSKVVIVVLWMSGRA